MSSPRVGVVRDSMLTNPLLIKAPLGHIRSRGQTVPGPDFTFGSSTCPMGDGGVSEILSSWRVQQQGGRGHSAPDRILVPDFLSLNRDAVKSGLVTAKELSQYRAQRGGAMLSHAPKPPGGGSSRRPAVPDITFGVSTERPTSPLSDVLSHQYAHRWIQEQLSRNQTSNQKQLQRIKPGCIPDTRTSLLRRSTALPHIKKPFKLSCYTQVPPSLNTFRNEADRLRAFEAHHSDSVSRRGAAGFYSLN